jgi:uncharacterized membrane protein
MASYSAGVQRDIARWAQSGLIDAATADALARDVDANERRSLSFGSILAMMAALLFGAAILIFVGANWEAIPRLARVGALFAVIVAGYVGGAVLKSSDHAAIGEALWIVAAAAFGGAIALIGQMYHLSGDESSAVLTWCAGTALAAVALRSNPLNVFAAGIADGWLIWKLVDGFDFWRGFQVPYLFGAIAFGLFIVSYWTRSQPTRHLIILSVIVYLAFLAAYHDSLWIGSVLAAIAAAAFAIAVLVPAISDQILQLGGRLPLHALIGFLVGIVVIQFSLADQSSYDQGFTIASVAALAGIAAAVVMAGRESRGVRWVAYLGFGFELFLIYAVTMQSMLGTAGFFLAAAAILAVLAVVIIRVEKRMKATAIAGAAS